MIGWKTEVPKQTRTVEYMYPSMLCTGKHRPKKVNRIEVLSKYSNIGVNLIKIPSYCKVNYRYGVKQ